MKIMFPDDAFYRKPMTDLTVYEGKYRDFLTKHECHLTTDTWYDCQLIMLTSEPNGSCKSILVHIRPANAKTFRFELKVLLKEELSQGLVKFDEFDNLPWPELVTLIHKIQSGECDPSNDRDYRIMCCKVQEDEDVQAI